MLVSEKRGLVNGGEIEKEEITRFMSEDKPIDLKAPPSRQSPHHGQMHNNQNMININTTGKRDLKKDISWQLFNNIYNWGYSSRNWSI